MQTDREKEVRKDPSFTNRTRRKGWKGGREEGKTEGQKDRRKEVMSRGEKERRCSKQINVLQ